MLFDYRIYFLEVEEFLVKIRIWIEKFFGGQKVKEFDLGYLGLIRMVAGFGEDFDQFSK